MTDHDPQQHFLHQAARLRVLIQAAQQINALPDALTALTDYAALLIEAGYTSEAAHLLAYVLHHPDVPYQTYDRADDLFITLESHLCPSVIADAKAEAAYITLRGAIDQAFQVVDQHLSSNANSGANNDDENSAP